FLLGPSLLPAATRQGESAPGGCARLGLQMDPPPLSLLARAPPLRGVYLSPGTPAPWLLADPKSVKGVLNDRKKTLTAPLRACVRPGPGDCCAPCPLSPEVLVMPRRNPTSQGRYETNARSPSDRARTAPRRLTGPHARTPRWWPRKRAGRWPSHLSPKQPR